MAGDRIRFTDGTPSNGHTRGRRRILGNGLRRNRCRRAEPALRGGMEGAGVAYHAAGINAFCLRDPSEMMRVNIEGSVNVIRAAAETGVGRVVYTSSASASGEAAGTVGNENSPHRGSCIAKKASSDAMRMSMPSSISSPPAMQ